MNARKYAYNAAITEIVSETFDPITACSLKPDDREGYMLRLYENAERLLAKREERRDAIEARRFANIVRHATTALALVASITITLIVVMK